MEDIGAKSSKKSKLNPKEDEENIYEHFDQLNLKEINNISNFRLKKVERTDLTRKREELAGNIKSEKREEIFKKNRNFYLSDHDGATPCIYQLKLNESKNEFVFEEKPTTLK